MSRQLWSFHGGIHPPQHKQESTVQPIGQSTIARELVIPLHQHIGESATPIVEVGEQVLKGQKIARAQGYVSASVHASSSGTVIAIEERPIPHPSGLSAHCIVIASDGADRWHSHRPEECHYSEMEPSHLRNLIRSAGIVGLGGAGFPSFIKLNPTSHAIDTLILNGVECEPYITCDDMLMRERGAGIVAGARIMRHAVQAREVLIAIEDNKPEAIATMEQAVANEEGMEVVVVPTRYPQGGEKQLIKVLTGKECPSHGLPFQIGIVVHNVATAYAIHRAIDHCQPLVSRIVTITGDGVKEPRNLEVPIGTPIQHLLEQCGGVAEDLERIVIGGPLMGFAMPSSAVPIIKTSNCILATRRPATPPPPAMPCIRCGACADACPVELLPQQLYWHARAKEFDKSQEYDLFDCIECGCCAYVCPSNIPLVHYYRFAKSEIWAQEREKEKADLARQRHESRLARLAREQAEKEAKLAQKKAALQEKAHSVEQSGEQGSDPGEADKQAAIQAALARAQAKKEQQQEPPKNTESLTPAQQRQVDEAEVRRSRVDAAATAESSKDAE
jgi:electron transport complex protein RnfC